MTVMTVQVDIGAVLKDGFTTAFGQASAAAVKLDNAITAVDAKIVTMKGWAAAKKETAAAKEEWERASAKAKALGAQLAATANPTEDFKNKVAAARKEADQAKAAFVGAGTGLRAMDVQMRAAGVSIKAVKVELDAAEKSMAALARRKDSLGRLEAAKTANNDRKSAVKGQVLETAALAMALGAPIHKAIEFESAMADVKKAVDFVDGEKGLRAMESAIMDMARTTPLAHAEIAAIVTAGGKAGIAEKDLRTYAETVSKLAVAWDMTPEAVGTAMGKIGNVMKIGVGDLMLVGDAVNKLADSGTSNESEIVDVLKRISGVGLAAHMSAQQLAALSATFIDLGAAPEVAATGINAMVQKLMAAPAGTAKFKASLQEIGWTAEDMQQSILKDAQGTIVKFLESLQGLDEAKRANLMADMFGMEYSDDMARLIAGMDTYRRHLKTVGDEANYAGSTMQNYGIYAATTASRLKLATNAMNAGAIRNGTGLLGVVKDVADTFATLSNGAGQLAGAYPTVTKAIVYTTAALVGYKVAKLAVSFASVTIRGALLDTRIAFTRVATAATVASVRMRGFSAASMMAGFRGAGAAMLAFAGRPIAAVLAGLKAVRIATMLNPIGLLVNGLIIAVPLIIEYWDKIWKVIKPAINFVSGAFQAIPVVADAVKWAFGDDKKPADKGDADLPDGDGTPGAVNDNAVNDNAPIADFGARSGAVRSGGGPVYQINGNINITVQAQPGQDPAAVAGEVKKTFQGATSGGALYDHE